MTIVCGVDFSPLSDHACAAAAGLARKQGTQLVLVHAVAAPARPTDEISSQVLAAARNSLAARAAGVRTEGTDVIERVEIGPAYEVVSAVAGETNASMIILAATSRAATRWLLGSTADRIAATVAVPVLLIREGFPVLEWLKGSHSLRVTLATDLSPISDNAVEFGSQLSTYGPCQFTVAHLSWPPETYRRLGVEGPMALDHTHPAVDKAVRNDLESTAARLRKSGPAEIVIDSSFRKPAEALNRIAEGKGADLLIVGHHPDRNWRVWEGSIARALMSSAPMSVACVPDTDIPKPRSLPRIHRVVAATDLSHAGNSAVAYALSIVERRGHVTVLHVLEDTHPDAAARRRIIDGLTVLTISPDVTQREFTVGVELVESDERGAAICDFADRDKADLICIASGGRSRLPRVLFGSVAQEVLLLSRKPVLVVPSVP
jgi:nucleotide-binding universal stress UspA family protein